MENEIIIGDWSLKKALKEKRKIDEKLASQTPESIKIESLLYINHPCSTSGFAIVRTSQGIGRMYMSDHELHVRQYMSGVDREFPDFIVDRIKLINENSGFGSSKEIEEEINHRDIIPQVAEIKYRTHPSKSILCYEWKNRNARTNYKNLFVGQEDALAKIITEGCIEVISQNLAQGRPFPQFSLDSVTNSLANASGHYDCGCCEGGNIGGVELVLDENKTKELAQQQLEKLSGKLSRDRYIQAVMQAGLLDINAEVSDTQKSAIYKILAGFIPVQEVVEASQAR